uniref:KRAB domain-containing protein n=1 Tax=Crocodylus porosus TaxID=8502 RepID=A0A7M4EQX6_CROPO
LGLLVFENVALHFTRKEWELLEDEDKVLYQDQMLRNYQALVSLGKALVLAFLWKVHQYISPILGHNIKEIGCIGYWPDGADNLADKCQRVHAAAQYLGSEEHSLAVWRAASGW